MSGLNDGGDFCGYAVGVSAPYVGFINVGGVLVSFTVPRATQTRARAINNPGQVVGDYGNPDGSVHGFLRAADGTLTYPINAGPLGTQIMGINDKGIMAGCYANGKGEHGFVLRLPRAWSRMNTRTWAPSSPSSMGLTTPGI